MESMNIINEGINSAWRVINDQGGDFPAAALFETKDGSFKNQPTEAELLRRLESMLSEFEDPSGNIELSGWRRSFTVEMRKRTLWLWRPRDADVIRCRFLYVCYAWWV